MANYTFVIDLNLEQDELPYLIAHFGPNPYRAMFQYDLGGELSDPRDKTLTGPRLQLMYYLVEAFGKSLEDGGTLLAEEKLSLPYEP